MNQFFKYFDIFSPLREMRGLSTRMALTATPVIIPSWVPQWIALFAGVIIQPYFAGYQKTGHWGFAGLGGWLVAALIIAFVTFPAVYRSAFDPTKPWIVQIVPIFTAGLGWNTLFASALQAATGGTAPPLHV